MPPSIPFVTFDKGHFDVNPEAVAFLESLGAAKLSVVALAGPYRHGKSFLLNRVVLEHPPGEGFSVGETVNACTKGLHLSTKLLKASNATDGDYSVLVIDTEGLGAMTADETHDARIFSLALLLSSLFIYNSKGTIDQPAINNLSLVANISKHIQTSSDSSDSSDLGEFMPSFLWVVRDFALELVDAQGREITESEYLEESLRPVPEATAEKNRVRDSLRGYFRHRGCITMPRPCDDKHIKALNTLSDDVLSSAFMEKARLLREQLQTLARPKKACGSQVTGNLLAKLAAAYCASINKGAAPAIKDSWSLISADECGRAATLARSVFEQHLSENAAELPDTADGEAVAVPADKLEKLFVAAFKRALDSYDAAALGDQADSVRDRLRDALRERASQVRAGNKDKIARKADAACAELDERLLDFPSFEAVRKRLSELESDFYRAVGVDTTCRAAWAAEAVKRTMDWATRYHADLATRLATAEVKASILDKVEAKLDDAEARGKMRDAKASETIADLEARVRDLSESSFEWEEQIAQLKRELAQQVDDSEELSASHRVQTQLLREEVATEAARASEAESRAETQQRVAEKRQTELDDARAAAEANSAELLRLRDAQNEFLEREQHLGRLEDQNVALTARCKALSAKLDKNAEESRQQMEKLFKESQAAMEGMQKARDDAKRKCKTAEAAETKLKQDLDREVKTLTSAAQEAKKDLHKAQQALDKEVIKHKEEVDKVRAELAEVRAESSANAKRFQKQLEEQSTQQREELRKRTAKSRDEQERLFQEKVSATSAVQAAETRAKHAETELKEAKAELATERERAREHNYPSQLTELRGKLSQAEKHNVLLSNSLKEKSDLSAEQQSQIIELEDALRNIQSRHEAEKVQLLCDHATKLGEQKS